MSNILGLRLFFILNLIALLFLSISFGREYLRHASIERDIRELEAERDALAARNSEITALSESIQTQYYLEKEGRLKYGLSKPGESLVIITDDQNTSPGSKISNSEENTENQLEDEETRPSNMAAWWAYFFDHTAYENYLQKYGVNG